MGSDLCFFLFICLFVCLFCFFSFFLLSFLLSFTIWQQYTSPPYTCRMRQEYVFSYFVHREDVIANILQRASLFGHKILLALPTTASLPPPSSTSSLPSSLTSLQQPSSALLEQEADAAAAVVAKKNRSASVDAPLPSLSSSSVGYLQGPSSSSSFSSFSSSSLPSINLEALTEEPASRVGGPQASRAAGARAAASLWDNNNNNYNNNNSNNNNNLTTGAGPRRVRSISTSQVKGEKIWMKRANECK